MNIPSHSGAKKHRLARSVRYVVVAAVTAGASVAVTSRVLRAQAQPPPPPPITRPPGSASSPANRPSTAPAPRPATGPSTVQLPPEHVIASVGAEKITVADFEAFVADLPPRDQAMVRGPGRRELIDYLVRMKLVSAEAKRRKLDESLRFKRQMDRVREQVLEGALVADVHEKLDDATLRKYFDENKAAVERIAARHVLIRTPDSSLPATPGKPALTEEQAKAKADEVVRRVKAGEDFAKVAREVSDDPQSGPEGGDLGSFTRDSKIAQFSQAAFALKEGEVSQPVRTPFGWHVIQVTQKFDTFEELADLLRHQLAPMRMDELVRDLRKNQKVELDEAFTGPEPAFDPSAPPGPPPLGAEVPPFEPR